MFQIFFFKGKLFYFSFAPIATSHTPRNSLIAYIHWQRKKERKIEKQEEWEEKLRKFPNVCSYLTFRK